MFTLNATLKKICVSVFTILLLSFSKTASSQNYILYVAPGESMYVAATDTLHTFGLGLTPNTELNLSGISIYRNTTLTNIGLVPAINRAFTFTPTAPDFRGLYKFFYADAELNGIPEADLKLLHYSGSWAVAATANHDLTQNIMTSATVSILPTELTLAPLVALPLTWLDVNARLRDKHVAVTWETADESALDGYTIMHSVNGINWKSIGTANAKLGTNNNYTFLHTNAAVGKNFYRIVARELTGETKLSKVVTVVLASNNLLSVYPNPVSRGQNGTLQLGKAGIVQVFSSNGSLVSETVYPAGTFTLSTKGLLPGVYLISNGENIIKWIIQ